MSELELSFERFIESIKCNAEDKKKVKVRNNEKRYIKK